MPVQKLELRGFDLALLCLGHEPSKTCVCLCEVLPNVCLDSSNPPKLCNSRVVFRLLMKLSHYAGKRFQRPSIELPRGEFQIRTLMVGEPPHFHRPVDDGSCPPYLVTTRWVARDRYHPEIDVRGESLVQLYLRKASEASAFQRSEVEEAEVHWLLHFEYGVSVQKHPGDVRLADFVSERFEVFLQFPHDSSQPRSTTWPILHLSDGSVEAWLPFPRSFVCVAERVWTSPGRPSRILRSRVGRVGGRMVIEFG